MKFKKPIILLIAALTVLICSVVLFACGDDDPHNIPPVTKSTVLYIEHDKLEFARGMSVDTPKVIEQAHCALIYDDGTSITITAAMLRDGTVSSGKFSLGSAGRNKTLTVSYKSVSARITYNVTDYRAELYLDEQCTELWRSAPINAALSDADLELNVTVDLYGSNVSVDKKLLASDEKRAKSFKGWYTRNGEKATGTLDVTKPPEDENTEAVIKFHAEYLSDSELASMDIRYDGSKRIFAGYNGPHIETLEIPEGVTYLDFGALFKTESSLFDNLIIPSTAAISLPLQSRIDTAGLKYIEVDASNPVYSSYNGAVYSKDHKIIYIMPAELTENVVFHSDLTEFAGFSCAFWKATALTIPDSVTTLHSYCFAYSNIADVVWGKNVSKIMTGAFFQTQIRLHEDKYALYTVLPSTGGRSQYRLNTVMDKSITDFKVMRGTASIAANAFAGCVSLKTVDLGTDLKSIGESAFSGCVSLTEIDLPYELEEMGAAVFAGCTALTAVTGLPSVSYNDGSTVHPNYLPDKLFNECSALTNIKIPHGTETIGSSVFSDCSSLNDITIPDTVKEIGSSAFRSSGITDIKLPSALESMGAQAFSHSRLRNIDLSAAAALTELPARCFEYTELTSIDLPDRFTEIPEYCFYACGSLAKLSLGNITTIGSRAFQFCTALTGIDWGNGKVETIETRAFSDSGLVTVQLPDSVVTVKGYAFSSCPALENFGLGANVSVFGIYGYDIDGMTFDGTTAPVLYSCKRLKTVSVPTENPHFTVSDGVLYGKTVCGIDYGNGGVLYYVPPAYPKTKLELPDTVRIILPYSVHSQSVLTEIKLSNGVINIGKGAFYNSTSIQKLNIPSTVSNIGASILLGCNGITDFSIDPANSHYSSDGNLIYRDDTLIMYLGISETAEIRSGTTAISSAVFMNNTKIKSVVIPDSVTEIGAQAFSGCTNLASIGIGKGLKTLGANAFASLPALRSIIVDRDNMSFKAINNVLYSKDGSTLLLCAAKNGMTELTIEHGVNEIGDYAFAYHATLRSLILPDGIKKLGDYSFYECRALEKFYGSVSLTEIGKYAFGFKTSINPDDKTEVRSCDKLKTVLLYSGLKKIGDSAFYGQYGLERAYYQMTESEYITLISDSGINSAFLTRGCSDGKGSYYNTVKQYLYNESSYLLPPDGFEWFRFDSNGDPVPHKTKKAAEV